MSDKHLQWYSFWGAGQPQDTMDEIEYPNYILKTVGFGAIIEILPLIILSEMAVLDVSNLVDLKAKDMQFKKYLSKIFGNDKNEREDILAEIGQNFSSGSGKGFVKKLANLFLAKINSEIKYEYIMNRFKN